MSLFLLVGAITVGEATAQEAPAWPIYQFLRTHCAECHGGHLDRPKAELGYILDLPRLIDEAYVIPGEPDNSDLFIALVTEDPDLRMPPDDSESPKPDAAGIEQVRQWIADGAVVFDLPAADSTAPAVADGDSSSREMSLLRKLGRLHPVLVHFPIAFLLCAGVAAGLRHRRRDAESLRGLVRGCLWAGAIGALFAAGCGWLNARFEGFAGEETELHRWLGVSTAILAALSLVFWEHLERRAANANDRRHAAVLALLVLAAILVALAGHTGGELSYGDDYLPFF